LVEAKGFVDLAASGFLSLVPLASPKGFEGLGFVDGCDFDDCGCGGWFKGAAAAEPRLAACVRGGGALSAGFGFAANGFIAKLAHS
jgi:hypothetical protein